MKKVRPLHAIRIDEQLKPPTGSNLTHPIEMGDTKEDLKAIEKLLYKYGINQNYDGENNCFWIQKSDFPKIQDELKERRLGKQAQ